MFTLSILWKNWISQSYHLWLRSFFKTWISCFKYAATQWTVSAYFRCLAVTQNPSEQFVAQPSVFGTCALCPRQRLLGMPCQNAAVVFRARVQLHITRQLGNQNKESEIIDLYRCVDDDTFIQWRIIYLIPENPGSLFIIGCWKLHTGIYFLQLGSSLLPVVGFGLFELFSLHSSPWKQVKSHQKPLQSFGLSC